MADFFISYNRADRHWAEWIAWQLEEADYSTVLQAWDFSAGTNFIEQMDQATKEAKRTIAVLSPDYLTSPFTPSEWQAAFALDPTGKQGKLLSVRVRECELTGLLAQIRYIDLVGLAEEHARELLLVEVKEGRLKPSQPPGFPGPTETTGPRPDYPGQARLLSPAELAAYEQQFRQRLREYHAADAPYYIPLAGETTEAVITESPSQAPRSVRRRRQRAQAEYCEWIQARQELKRVKLDTLREGIDKYPCLILLGDPGSGKTTALEHLAYELADESDKLPVPLRLSEFGSGMSVEAFIKQGWSGSAKAGYWNASELAGNMENYLAEGKLFLLFDALNEMPREAYKVRVQALRQFIDRWEERGNHFMVTCRVLDYGEELSGLQRVEIQPLNDGQIKAFVQKELPDNWSALWDALSPDGTTENRSLLGLARNPYLLTMMIDIFAQDGQLGRNRAELMTRFTQILMQWYKQKCPPELWLEPDVQREALSILAFEMQKRMGSGTMVDTAKVKAVLPHQVQPDPDWPPQPSPPDQILTLAANANIIEMPVDRSSVRFYHQLLQEYFAAREMLKHNPVNLAEYWRWPWLEEEMPLWVRPEKNYDPLPPPPPTGWEEATILAAGLAIENDEQMVQALIEVNPVLAGRCVYEGQAKVSRRIRQRVIEALLVTIAEPEVALRVRIAAGEVLGYLGDPRLGEMVTVPGGKFVMGEGKERHKPSLPAYRFGKYPLTNAEYERFIEAGGYQEKRWWTETGWQRKESDNWAEPRYWRDGRFNKPNQPVVGVSWYECVAFCRWLSAETGQVYRLPTEAEWEKAARDTDGRQYPWGNKFEASQLNAYEGNQKVRATTPVGIYPTGVSPVGLFDCAGNVWEWCATEWRKSYPYNAQEDEWSANYLDGGGARVLRGGSWFNFRNLARCAFRYWYYPDYWNYDFGCRLVSPI